MTELQLAIREIKAEQAFHLRHSVLRPGRPEEHSRYPSDSLPETFHIGVFNSAVDPVAVATFTPHELEGVDAAGQHMLLGMAVDAALQGQGLGKLLLEHSFEVLRERGCRFLWCKAREVAVPFYRRLGFEGHGEWYDTPLSGMHLVMYRKL